MNRYHKKTDSTFLQNFICSCRRTDDVCCNKLNIFLHKSNHDLAVEWIDEVVTAAFWCLSVDSTHVNIPT